MKIICVYFVSLRMINYNKFFSLKLLDKRFDNFEGAKIKDNKYLYRINDTKLQWY